MTLSRARTGHLVVLNGGRGESSADERLARSACRGEAEGLAGLFDRHGSEVRRLFVVALCDPSVVDELTHDVFLRFVDAYRNGQGRRPPAEVLRSLAVRALRGHLGAKREPGFPTVSPFEAPLATLSRDERIAFALSVVERLDIDSVARAMGWSVWTTRRRVARARERIWSKVRAGSLLPQFVDAPRRDTGV